VGRELSIEGDVFFAGRHGQEELPIGPNCADPGTLLVQLIPKTLDIALD
jgi:hypothetical protein